MGKEFNKWYWDNWTPTCKKQTWIPTSHHTKKSTQNRSKAIKLPEENIRVNLSALVLDWMFRYDNPKSTNDKKIDKLELTKIYNFCVSNNTNV